MVTRRKERKFGIWINTDYRQFLQVPTYLALFSNRPFDAIASPEVERRQQLGLNNVLLTQRVGPDYADVVPNDAFRSAFVRLRSEHGLYREDTSAVTFLTPTLFRTGIPLPAEVPIGTYDVEIKLFSDGALVTRTETAFEIVKVGFEQFVATTARQNGLVYGLVTAVHGADDRLDGVDRVPQGLARRLDHGRNAGLQASSSACRSRAYRTTRADPVRSAGNAPIHRYATGTITASGKRARGLDGVVGVHRQMKRPAGLRRARKRQHHAAAEAPRDFGDAVKPDGIAADIDRAAALLCSRRRQSR